VSLIDCREVAFGYGGRPLVENASFAIEENSRVALVGRNGAGKSSLLDVIRGVLPPLRGGVTRKTGLRITMLEQRVPLADRGTARAVVATGLPQWGEQLAEYHRLAHALTESSTPAELAEFDRLQRMIEANGGFQREPEIERALERVGVDPEEDWSTLSIGRRRRVLLARAIVSAPDLLILDEPTNHLDIAAIEWLEEFILKWRGSVIFVSHDRAFARRIATHVLLVDRGRVVPYDCSYDAFVVRREADDEALATAEKLADKVLAKEEAWAKQGVKARRTRADARLRELGRMRDERRMRRSVVGKVKIGTQDAVRSGDLVVDLKDVGFSYDVAPIVRDFTTQIQRGDKIGLIGPNGAGKTTLLRLILGELTPTHGVIRHGSKLEIAYFDQAHAKLDETRTVGENVTPGDFVIVGGQRRHIVGFLGDFLFRPDQIRGSVKDLSGGERNRLLLARLFTRPTNVLVLDEPTNDLDAETVDVLEDLLIEYAGTVLVVSHDREFLNRVVTSTMVFEGDGRVAEYVGGYDDWLRQRSIDPTAAAAASSPRGGRNVAAAPARKKLTYSENLELAALPAKIESLEIEQAALHAALADPALYTRDGQEFATRSTRLELVAAELTTAYRRWEELEERK
jgi:ABC transport system ATP-binding/permease protein